MIVNSGLLRLVGAVVRRADARLAGGAARNAAASVSADQAGRLETATILRDLQFLLSDAGQDVATG